MKHIRIGTRGSDLALAQALETERLLCAQHQGLQVSRSIIKTIGDRRTDVPLADVAALSGGAVDKGVFTKELEVALLDGRADIAVHSLKDMPTLLDQGFCLAAVLERAPVEDVFLSCAGGNGLADLADGARVGTSSVRRKFLLQQRYPGLAVCDIRGNVPTRIEKLASGEFDGVILARAGLQRLGLMGADGRILGDHLQLGGRTVYYRVLPANDFLPAAGQGAIALEVREDHVATKEIAASINHWPSWHRVVAEREFLRLLGAGCHTPVGVYSQIRGQELLLRACVFAEDRPQEAPRMAKCHGGAERALELGRELFERLK